ncbi:hypothetical protein EGW08_005210 [Elysia chlorotica]|uniref:Nanos-type domain-containing protein n=1 Tax=Elysia chlorotica TaxID=188477 RepID=A0A3S0ZZQ8_ELYCH|nr:hypothetical protein EGW08_005210 [Elysia chlorotica]
MYTLVAPAQIWPHHAPMGHNQQQVIYSHFPTAYVMAPVPAQALYGQGFRPVYSGGQISAWSNTPAAAQAASAPDSEERMSSSDDDVFLPSQTSRKTNDAFYTGPYFIPRPAPSVASSGPETPKLNFANTMDAFCPSTPGIRLPEKYTRARAKIGARKNSERKIKRSSINGSLNSSGGTSGSSHNTTDQSIKQNSFGADLHLANLSDVLSANTSGSDVSPPGAAVRRRLDRSVAGEMCSVSSCVLPMSLRAALNEDPPEPTTACAPLKTSSPIRESDEFLSLPTVIPSKVQKAVRQTLAPMPVPIGAEIHQRKLNLQQAIRSEKENYNTMESENFLAESNQRKRRDGRYITGLATCQNNCCSPSDRKFPRVSTAEEEIAAAVASEAEDMDQCLRILKQREMTGAAEELARRREEFLLVLEAERERQRRLVLPKKAPKMNCKFCRNNGESEEIYTKHKLHDKERTVCPILRHYVCRLCNSTGDFAHTIRHCPFNNRKDRIAWKATFMV